MELISQDQVDFCDPALMFTIPRLAIVAGLLLFPESPLNLDSCNPRNLSHLFRPFRNLLSKIRELLWTMTAEELAALEKSLCSMEEPQHNTLALGVSVSQSDNHDVDDDKTFPSSYPHSAYTSNFIQSFLARHPNRNDLTPDMLLVGCAEKRFSSERKREGSSRKGSKTRLRQERLSNRFMAKLLGVEERPKHKRKNREKRDRKSVDAGVEKGNGAEDSKKQERKDNLETEQRRKNEKSSRRQSDDRELRNESCECEVRGSRNQGSRREERKSGSVKDEKTKVDRRAKNASKHDNSRAHKRYSRSETSPDDHPNTQNISHSEQNIPSAQNSFSVRTLWNPNNSATGSGDRISQHDYESSSRVAEWLEHQDRDYSQTQDLSSRPNYRDSNAQNPDSISRAGSTRSQHRRSTRINQSRSRVQPLAEIPVIPVTPSTFRETLSPNPALDKVNDAVDGNPTARVSDSNPINNEYNDEAAEFYVQNLVSISDCVSSAVAAQPDIIGPHTLFHSPDMPPPEYEEEDDQDSHDILEDFNTLGLPNTSNSDPNPVYNYNTPHDLPEDCSTINNEGDTKAYASDEYEPLDDKSDVTMSESNRIPNLICDVPENTDPQYDDHINSECPNNEGNSPTSSRNTLQNHDFTINEEISSMSSRNLAQNNEFSNNEDYSHMPSRNVELSSEYTINEETSVSGRNIDQNNEYSINEESRNVAQNNEGTSKMNIKKNIYCDSSDGSPLNKNIEITNKCVEEDKSQIDEKFDGSAG